MRFILYTPKGVKTGGPEAIHQLNLALKEIGFECYMLATWGTGRKKGISDYEMYHPEFIRWWSLGRGDVVIVPEYLSRIPYFISKRVDSIVLWWLSVDNSPFFDKKSSRFSSNTLWSTYSEPKEIGESSFFRKLNQIPKFIKYESKIMKVRISDKLYDFLSSKIILDEVTHIFQSNYAKKFVSREFKLNGLMVTDYTRQNSVLSIKETKMAEIEETTCKFRVAYNPNKGLGNILILEKYLDPCIQLIPLRGFTYNQLIYIFDKVDLYLDLGNLPGKDRLPREAIFAGCPIMLAALGAGSDLEDFAIPNKYRLQMEFTTPIEAAQSLLKILKLGKSNNLEAQKSFRESVSQEKANFYREVSEFTRLFMNN